MLPTELAVGIATALQGVPTKALAQSVHALSAHYRGDVRGGRRAIRSDTDVLAYLAYRMPATYAAIAAALVATADRRRNWRLRTVLDVGCRPGTAMWAAAQMWPSVETFVLVENDARMIAMGKRLAQASSNPVIRDGRWSMVDMTTRPELPSCDVVIAAYAPGELAPARLEDVVTRLWSVCRDTAIIVEPGTPRGFTTVRTSRDMLGARGDGHWHRVHTKTHARWLTDSGVTSPRGWSEAARTVRQSGLRSRTRTRSTPTCPCLGLPGCPLTHGSSAIHERSTAASNSTYARRMVCVRRRSAGATVSCIASRSGHAGAQPSSDLVAAAVERRRYPGGT